MNLEQFKEHLAGLVEINFLLENGNSVPSHFHITEMAVVNKNLIDCGGNVRKQQSISFQLWVYNDSWHRLTSTKLLDIIQKAETSLLVENSEVFIEYQGDTVGIYALDFKEGSFILKPTFTDCADKEACGLTEKTKVNMADLGKDSSCCSPKSKCC